MGCQKDFFLGDWLVSPTRNLLTRGEIEARLDPGAMDVLVYLCERPGSVVSSDELIAAVWKGRIVDDNQIYKRIAQLREALGGGAAAKAILETIPKRGYRITVRVKRVAEADDSLQLFELPPVSADSTTPNGRFYLTLCAIAAVAITSLTFWFTSSSPPNLAANLAPESDVTRLTVLPFEFLGPDMRESYIATGLQRQLTYRLASLTGISVVSESVLARATNRPPSPEEVIEELSVHALLEGTVTFIEGDLRLSVALIDTDSGVLVWADTYEFSLDQAQTMQLTVMQNVAESLGADATEIVRTRSATAGVDPEAYRLFLRALSVAGNITPMSYGINQEFHDLLTEVSRRDPEFSPALSLRAIDLAQSMLRPARRDGSDMPPRAERERLIAELANQALRINESDALAHAALGWLHCLNDRKDDGRREFEQALEISPSDRNVLIDFAFLAARNEFGSQALDVARRISIVDPLIAPNFVAYAHWRRGDLDAAANAVLAVEGAPGSFRFRHLTRSAIEVSRGRYEIALEYLARDRDELGALQAVPTNIALRAYLYGRAGARDDAQRNFEQLVLLNQVYVVGTENLALAHLGVDNVEQALSLLRQAADEHINDHGWIRRSEIVINLYRDPVLDTDAFVAVRGRL